MTKTKKEKFGVRQQGHRQVVDACPSAVCTIYLGGQYEQL
jgi:hypothetical protein